MSMTLKTPPQERWMITPDPQSEIFRLAETVEIFRSILPASQRFEGSPISK